MRYLLDTNVLSEGVKRRPDPGVASWLVQHEAGALQVPIADAFPMAEAEAAYDRFTAGGKLGKIVLVSA